MRPYMLEEHQLDFLKKVGLIDVDLTCQRSISWIFLSGARPSLLGFFFEGEAFFLVLQTRERIIL